MEKSEVSLYSGVSLKCWIYNSVRLPDVCLILTNQTLPKQVLCGSGMETCH